MAIYFPPNRYVMDNDYLPFVNTDPAAMSAWFSFLDGLYKAIVAVGNDQSELPHTWQGRILMQAGALHTFLEHLHGCVKTLPVLCLRQ